VNCQRSTRQRLWVSSWQSFKSAVWMVLGFPLKTGWVSKSMLSQIERAQANLTVAVIWRLANALGIPLLELLAEP
jgi:transcriptional regulator with XRE-family HTH domain